MTSKALTKILQQVPIFLSSVTAPRPSTPEKWQFCFQEFPEFAIDSRGPISTIIKYCQVTPAETACLRCPLNLDGMEQVPLSKRLVEQKHSGGREQHEHFSEQRRRYSQAVVNLTLDEYSKARCGPEKRAYCKQ